MVKVRTMISGPI